MVVFGMAQQRYGPGGVYEPADAYWLTSENNSVGVEETGGYRNQGRAKDPGEASLSLEEFRELVASYRDRSPAPP